MSRRPSQLPGRLLSKDLVILLEGRLWKITEMDYTLPLILVTVDVEDQITQEKTTKSVRWDDRVFTYKPFSVDLEGAEGKVGRVTVEPASVPDEDDKIGVRWRIHDKDGRQLQTEADVWLPAGKPWDETEAMASMLGFMSAEGERYEARMRGGFDPDPPMFNEEVSEFCYLNDTEIVMARLELKADRGVEL